jgi:hypothetical protein
MNAKTLTITKTASTELPAVRARLKNRGVIIRQMGGRYFLDFGGGRIEGPFDYDHVLEESVK